jgi:RNA polymerase sigma factor (sigma-70 family)
VEEINSRSTLTDEELWNLFRNGQQRAITDLFRRHYRRLYSYGMKISRNEDLTKDHIQEVFLEVWNKRDTLPRVQHVKAYLLKFLRRRIFHSLQLTEKQSEKDWLYAQYVDMPLSHEDLLVQEQLQAEVKEKLDRALQKLTPRQREVIYLRFFDNLSIEAISEITALKYQSVVNLVHEAIKKLRDHFTLTTSLLLMLETFFK